MARDDLLIQALSEFARTLVHRFEITDVLYDLTARSAAVLEVASAGVSLAQDDGRLRFVTGLDAAATRLERVQEEHQSGPCVDAFRTGEPVLVNALDDAETRWPHYVTVARELGFVAVAGIPMGIDGHNLGAMNIYDTRPRTWSDDDIRTARLLADVATSYVITASELQRQQRIAEQLEVALQSRIVIEQAKGIIAAERRISVDQAFDLLRNHARRHNADLRTTADAVVRLGLRP